MRTHVLMAALVLVTLFAARFASAVPWRGLVSIDLTADGQFAVIAGRKDHSIAIVDLTTQPYTFVNLMRPTVSACGRSVCGAWTRRQ